MKELKITVEAETTKAKNFIMDLIKLVDRYEPTEIIINSDFTATLNFRSLVELKLNTSEQDETKDKPVKQKKKGKHGRTPEPKRQVDVKKFKEAVDKLGGDNFSQNIEKAIDISGLSKSSITRVYYCKDEYKPAGGLLLDGCERLYKHVFGKEESVIAGNKSIDPESEKKNWIMIVRVRNSKKTTDPDVIADTIMNNNNIRRNTTFASREEIIDMINKRKQWLEAEM
ncbi:hypothetical protein B5E92_04295 [Erysipelatoclostridium sp. An15]|uniref:hypothetical protein n=1 Tax=Erysipelatoclostridium sp. An15 TaxID=1965566 RepID=UPI000B39D4A1|nr:hypothetical protein [Erysipelatoclostridium sp. An15]OUQ08279.1 hypothetical protein B5E92_04295 [Erysipelatoclostridium sp. An15]